MLYGIMVCLIYIGVIASIEFIGRMTSGKNNG